MLDRQQAPSKHRVDYRCSTGFFLTSLVLFPVVSTPGPADFRRCSSLLAAFALAAISNGMLELLLSPAGGVDMAYGEY
jgi:hypothetical protein